MEFNPHEDGSICLELFEIEVDVVAAAFREKIAEAEAKGNSFQQYYKDVARWKEDYRQYNHGVNPMFSPDALILLIEETEEKVDDILKEDTDPERFKRAGYRYKLGYFAEILLNDLTLATVLHEKSSDID